MVELITIMVLYYSRSGVIRKAAQMIAA